MLEETQEEAQVEEAEITNFDFLVWDIHDCLVVSSIKSLRMRIPECTVKLLNRSENDVLEVILQASISSERDKPPFMFLDYSKMEKDMLKKRTEKIVQILTSCCEGNFHDATKDIIEEGYSPKTLKEFYQHSNSFIKKNLSHLDSLVSKRLEEYYSRNLKSPQSETTHVEVVKEMDDKPNKQEYDRTRVYEPDVDDEDVNLDCFTMEFGRTLSMSPDTNRSDYPSLWGERNEKITENKCFRQLSIKHWCIIYLGISERRCVATKEKKVLEKDVQDPKKVANNVFKYFDLLVRQRGVEKQEMPIYQFLEIFFPLFAEKLFPPNKIFVHGGRPRPFFESVASRKEKRSKKDSITSQADDQGALAPYLEFLKMFSSDPVLLKRLVELARLRDERQEEVKEKKKEEEEEEVEGEEDGNLGKHWEVKKKKKKKVLRKKVIVSEKKIVEALIEVEGGKKKKEKKKSLIRLIWELLLPGEKLEVDPDNFDSREKWKFPMTNFRETQMVVFRGSSGANVYPIREECDGIIKDRLCYHQSLGIVGGGRWLSNYYITWSNTDNILFYFLTIYPDLWEDINDDNADFITWKYYLGLKNNFLSLLEDLRSRAKKMNPLLNLLLLENGDVNKEVLVRFREFFLQTKRVEDL